MSLNKKIFTGFAAVLAAGTFAVAASAQTTGEATKDGAKRTERTERKEFRRGEGFGMHGRRAGMRGMRELRGIELTDEQKAAIKTILETSRPDPAVREEMKTIMQAKRAGTITPEQQARMEQLHTQARQKAEMVHLQIQGVLTPEQRQQIETRKQEMRQRMEQRRQERQLRREQMQQKSTTDKPATK